MANVRLDQNGLAKAPVYEQTTPQLHRSGVSAVDAADPAGASSGVDCAGYQCCRFDVDISGTALSSLDVQALFWNSRLGQWFGGGSRQFTATERHSIVVEARGAIVFLKVIAFSGTSFSLSADYSLS